ncbi:MAG TPA: hypothetical protein VE152_09265 [Acidimicrobiales bacterium]|jgi:anti-sigma regulatory factor (Ser/Thr protein kinase)|nr:hypothetical protein [Acidimicrobiales bacterium]
MGERFGLRLERSTDAHRAAHQAIASLLVRIGRSEFIDDIALLVGELVTNAVADACGPILMRADHCDGVLRVEVRDFDNERPVLEQFPGPDGKSPALPADTVFAADTAIASRPGGKTMSLEFCYG